MPDFAANLSTLFQELPLAERFAAAERAGFDAVELGPLEAWSLPELARQLREHRLALVACELPASAPERPGRSLACDPERVAEFRELAQRGIDAAATLGSRFVICRAGGAATPCGEARLARTLVDNLRFVARSALHSGLHVLLEAVDTESVPGGFPNRTRQAVAVLEAVGARNLSLVYDVAHMHAMGERVRETIARHLPRIGHIQIAGCPGRSEPRNGAVDFDALLQHIDHIGHRGWVGCEYHPASGTGPGLDWIVRHRRLTPTARAVWGIPSQALEENALRERLRKLN